MNQKIHIYDTHIARLLQSENISFVVDLIYLANSRTFLKWVRVRGGESCGGGFMPSPSTSLP